jgi:hypothetical protein
MGKGKGQEEYIKLKIEKMGGATQQKPGTIITVQVKPKNY